MQALQNTLKTIAEHLGRLTPMAKLLIGSLMVILMMSLFLVALYAGRTSMAPLGLSASLSTEARAQAIDYLRVQNIPYEEEAGDLLVPTDRRTLVLATLTRNNIIRSDQINFDKIIQDDSPFRSRQENDRRYLMAKMNEVAAMISQWQGVDSARVMIDPAAGRGFGRTHVPDTASVNVMTATGELTQAQADAMANLVAGAHAGLKVENVKVIDARTGRYLRARGEDQLSPLRNLEANLAAERRVRDKLEGALGDIPGVRVSVNVQVDTRETITTQESFDEPKSAVRAESKHDYESTLPGPSGQPGVQPNTGIALANSGSGGSVTDSRQNTELVPAFPRTNSQIVDPGGQTLLINASIGVPRSYFISLYRAEQGDDQAEPDAAALDGVYQRESDRIKAYLEPLIDTRAVEGAVAGTVMVSMVHDLPIFSNVMNGGGTEAGDVGWGSSLAGNRLVHYVGLGGLAAISLVMMLLMVRRATVREELPTAQELVGIPPALAGADSDLVGEASEAEPALEGREVDDSTLRRQQMLGQINEMVQQAPADAAGLIRKWIRDDH